MNSPYVETDEEQRRWFSTFALNQSLGYSGSISALDHTATHYYHPTGHAICGPDPNLGDPGSYDYCGYETQYQPQSASAWNSSGASFEPIPVHIGRGYSTSCPPTWSLAISNILSTDAFPASYNQESRPLQACEILPPQTRNPGFTDGSNFSLADNTPTPLIATDPELSLGTAKPSSSPKMPEETRVDPPMVPYIDGAMPRQQSPRFIGDKYAASWVRGSGVERVGWCGFCSTWHRLKDSAYWYHMHYSHGISCVTGKQFKEPLGWRHRHGVTSYEALCGGCNNWVYIGRPERWRTPYYRHAYKCQMKTLPSLSLSRSRSKSRLPRKAKPTSRPESF